MSRLLVLLLSCSVLLMIAAVAHAVADLEAVTFQSVLERYGVATAVVAAFAFGVAASLTPCVYPMVPITVSIFGATRARTRLHAAALSGTFVLGIATLFAPLGMLSALSGKLMGATLSAPAVVVALSVLFAALACSMFGAFELALPSRFTHRLTNVGGIGFPGAFAMGLVLGLIAAPCTGPFLTGLVALTATSRDVWLGFCSFFAFALGLGAPFFLVGALALRLPKSGPWMLAVKWLSGVVLGYTAFAYLRDRFAVLETLTTSSSTVFGVSAITLLLTGGILSVVHITAEARGVSLRTWSRAAKLASIGLAIPGSIMFVGWQRADRSQDANIPQILWHSNENDARAEATQAGMPVLLDFGASWCAACGELDRKTFSDLRVRREVQRFVAIRVDATDDSPTVQGLQEKYRVVGLPTVILLDSSGREILRLNQFVDPQTFIAAARQAI